jgi:hypothetical protein
LRPTQFLSWRQSKPRHTTNGWCIVFTQCPSDVLLDRVRGRPLARPKADQADEIATWLRPKMKPSGLVQSSDRTGGGIHPMLISRARSATPYLYEFPFCRHISETYMQKPRVNSFKARRKRILATLFKSIRRQTTTLETKHNARFQSLAQTVGSRSHGGASRNWTQNL